MDLKIQPQLPSKRVNPWGNQVI